MDDWDLEVSPRAKTYSPDKRLEEFCVNFMGQGTDDNKKKKTLLSGCLNELCFERVEPCSAKIRTSFFSFMDWSFHSKSPLDPFIPFDSVLSGRVQDMFQLPLAAHQLKRFMLAQHQNLGETRLHVLPSSADWTAFCRGLFKAPSPPHVLLLHHYWQSPWADQEQSCKCLGGYKFERYQDPDILS